MLTNDSAVTSQFPVFCITGRLNPVPHGWGLAQIVYTEIHRASRRSVTVATTPFSVESLIVNFLMALV